MEHKPTEKYEVVLGIPNTTVIINGEPIHNKYIANKMWMQYAKEYFDETGVYVSAIANEGLALYNEEWGCPKYGEFVITFNCTANREFIKELYPYEKGVIYITKKLKKYFDQHTVTITRIDTYGTSVCYLTDKDNEEE